MQLEPYLNFYGRCEEALEFYRSVLGGSYEVMRFKDMPPNDEYVPPADMKDRVMHSRFHFDGGEFMASDGRGDTERPADSAVSLSLATKSVDEAKRIFTGLSQGGEIDMPMQQTFWNQAFGMFTDRFGIFWMISGPETQGQT